MDNLSPLDAGTGDTVIVRLGVKNVGEALLSQFAPGEAERPSSPSR